MRNIVVCFIIILFNYQSFCQEISGTWLGDYGKEKHAENQHELKFDIDLYNDSLIRGTRIQYYNHDSQYEAYTISGLYHKKDSTIHIVEENEISQNAAGFGDKGSYKMKLRIINNIMRFEGKWKNSSRGIFTSFSSKVYVEKPLDDKRHTAIGTDNETKYKRATNIIKTIEIDSTEQGHIKIEISDNAQDDNDVISLYINDSIAVHKKTISHDAIVIHSQITKSEPTCIIKMVAESQGYVPPCTALINIITNKKTYTISMESNYTYNGSVAIILK